MTTDISRKSFDHRKNYSGLISEQGRVQLDSDWNEEAAIYDRRWRAETLDIFGRCRVPQSTPNAFRIGIDDGNLTIGEGRCYVEGCQAENFGLPPYEFDPVLAELTGTAEVPFDQQPFLSEINFDDLDDGRYLVYLDVWYRDVTSIEDPSLIEKAVGIPTTSRKQTVWQVKIYDEVLGEEVVCSTSDEDIPGWLNLILPSDGRLSTQAVGVPSVEDPCLLPPSGGYRGLENRTYCVHIHSVEDDGNATFKWSRHNATITSAVNAIPSLNQLVVESTGKDSVLRFNDGDWVEIIDDTLEFSGQPVIIRRIEVVDDATNTITLNDPLLANTFPTIDGDENLDPARHTRVRRWDQSGVVRDTNDNLIVDLDADDSEGDIPVPAAGTSIELEDGVEITFDDFSRDDGRYRVDDFWIFNTRFIDASVEELDSEPPCGIHHHYCRLAIVDIVNGAFVAVIDDCRDLTPDDPENATGCCTVVVRPGENIQEAIDSLPEAGGCVCLKPGLHVINDVLRIEGSNISLHGETKGAIVRRIDDATALLVEHPAGLLITGVEITNIQFEFDNSEIDGSSLSPMTIGLDLCEDVTISGCGFLFQRAEFLTGVRISRCSQVQVEKCDFQTVMLGVWVIEGSSNLSILYNNFNITDEESGDGGLIAVFFESAFGASRIIGNEIVGYAFGISLNPRTLDADGASSLRASGSIIAENRIFRSVISTSDFIERKLFAIDVTASDCVIKDNEIRYSSHVYAGINVTGNRCHIENNRLQFFNQQLIQQPAIGILLGVTDTDSSRIIEGGRIHGNHIFGPQNAIVIFQNDGVNISENKINSQDDQVGFGVVLLEVDYAKMNCNQIENSLFGISASQGQNNRIVNNELSAGGAALTALQQTAFDFTQNRVENMRNWGFLGLQFIGKVTIIENHFVSCGYLQTPGIGIGLSGVFGELAIESCHVIDTGVSPDGSIINQPAWQIIADLVLDCRIQGNLVNYSDAQLLETNLEDRALWLRGLVDFEQISAAGNIEAVFGFSAQVLDNKFLGPGFSSLVEFQELELNDNVFVRFERIFFNNNFCWHVSTSPDLQRATVRLAARSAIVMGNHIKATTPFPSVDFQDVQGVFVGNITEGGTLNFTEFPVPETSFNHP